MKSDPCGVGSDSQTARAIVDASLAVNGRSSVGRGADDAPAALDAVALVVGAATALAMGGGSGEGGAAARAHDTRADMNAGARQRRSVGGNALFATPGARGAFVAPEPREDPEGDEVRESLS